MTNDTSNNWQADFFKLSEIFQPILPAYSELVVSQTAWPSLNDYQQFINNITPAVSNTKELAIKFVEQAESSISFEEQYESRIYLHGEVQTRKNNWHDFFQVLVWATFPKIKAKLNQLHFQASLQRFNKVPVQKQRTAIENFLTLFDECGSIIVSTEQNLLELIKDFKWKELFIDQRNAFSNKLQCIVFGHAMYEKALSPYLGMTSHSLLIVVDANFFKLPQREKFLMLDSKIEKILASKNEWSSKDLHPFPLLGVPGYYKENENKLFYDNESYFRPNRARKIK